MDLMDSFCGVADLKEETSASKIGCNSVVLLSIARASDFSTLKTLRQVDRFWAQAVSRVFTQRASVNLKPGERSLESLRSFKKDTKGIESKLKVLKIQCPSLIKLEEEEAGAFNDILQHLSTSLETLELAPQNSNFLTLFYPRIGSKGQFPFLRTLALSNQGYDILSFFPKLFEATPALEILTLSHLGEDNYDADFSFVLSPLQITGEDGSIRRNWELAPNLRSLTVICTLTPTEAEALGALPQAWQALDLCWKSNHEPELVVSTLEQLLKKNKESLRSLRLKYINYEFELQTKSHFQIPSSFTKLRLLEFCFEGWDFDHITFSFGTCKDLEEYCKMCPMLERVRIVIDFEVKTELKGFWSKFFPQTLPSEGGKCLNWVVEREDSEGKEVLVATRSKGWGSF